MSVKDMEKYLRKQLIVSAGMTEEHAEFILKQALAKLGKVPESTGKEKVSK